MVTIDGFSKDMTHITTWESVYQRQLRKLPVAQEWALALDLQPGETVADFGCGPGCFSMLAARLVGPAGLVLAIDRSDGALAYLRTLQEMESVTQIRRVQGDALEVNLQGAKIDAAFVTDMLHHTDNQEAILQNVFRLLPSGGRAVIAEFDPSAPGEYGPPVSVRVAAEQLRGWLESSGFVVERFWHQAMEHYAFLVRKP